jgi:hypothetical protein
MRVATEKKAVLHARRPHLVALRALVVSLPAISPSISAVSGCLGGKTSEIGQDAYLFFTGWVAREIEKAGLGE